MQNSATQDLYDHNRVTRGFMTGDNAKQQAINTAISQIEKMYGKGSIMRLGQRSVVNIKRRSTGSWGLDYALGGGTPRRKDGGNIWSRIFRKNYSEYAPDGRSSKERWYLCLY